MEGCINNDFFSLTWTVDTAMHSNLWLQTDHSLLLLLLHQISHSLLAHLLHFSGQNSIFKALFSRRACDLHLGTGARYTAMVTVETGSKMEEKLKKQERKDNGGGGGSEALLCLLGPLGYSLVCEYIPAAAKWGEEEEELCFGPTGGRSKKEKRLKAVRSR